LAQEPGFDEPCGNQVGAERIAEVMGVRHEVTDRKGARQASDLKGRIEFRDVSFAYRAMHLTQPPPRGCGLESDS
jgi:ABC-type multidrug transport system fused ATPase/permease subunit